MKMSSKFTCRFCKEQFDVPKGLYKHLQSAHNAGTSRDNRTCPICGVLCSKYEGYRDHLLYIHGQTDDGQKLTFKSVNEFLLWKTDLEMKHNCKYVLQSAPKVLPTKEKKYFYQCDRSDSKSKDRRDKKSMSVVMKTCSSIISVVEATGIFKVEYWDTHSNHSNTTTVQLTQHELDAAISSVEMVNAIDSDDSFDRSTSFGMPGNSSSPVSIVEKPSILSKTSFSSTLNSFKNSPVSNTVQKSKSSIFPGKIDSSKKKSSNTSILYSLASVACGKGIAKKPANKVKENKIVDDVSKPEVQVDSETTAETSNIKFLDKPTNEAQVPSDVSTITSDTTSAPSITVSPAAPLLPIITKTTSCGPPAIAPKITAANTNTIGSLFSTNSAFSNQFVIVNPLSLDQNAINSGQNILLSLGPIGQTMLPNSTTSQTVTSNSTPKSKEKNSIASGKLTPNRTDSTVKVNNSIAVTSVKSMPTTITSTTVSSSPITLPAGINNAPVILSSLPVGSTFMSVNNNLIPIASPSGAFIPTSLPPNIVLTPVVPSTTPCNKDSTKTTVSSAPLNSQIRLTAPSTVAITVSSIVKEPVYTSSSIKHLSSIPTSSTSPVSSTSAPVNSKISHKVQNKFVPITIATSVTPTNASISHRLASSISNSAANLPAPNSGKIKIESSSKTTPGDGIKFKSISDSAFDTSISSIDESPNSKRNPSARKRMPKNLLHPKASTKSSSQSTPVRSIAPLTPIKTAPVPASNTKLVNSQLNLAPLTSAPNVTIPSSITSQPLNNTGPFLFESSGEIYMLEPVENDPVANLTAPKSVLPPEPKKIKIDRSVQTTEISNAVALKSKLQRKRAAPPTDDSAVMLKVKCYQLEMKYLATQTECKRLKVELTKERLKNAELTGEKADLNLEEERLTESNRSKALEIMKEIEDKYSGNKNVHIYTMTKTSVLRSLYEDLEELCIENGDLHKELENYRAHDKFYKNLKKRLYDEDF